VAWGGLTHAAAREISQQFFHARVWKADDVLRELTAVYRSSQAISRQSCRSSGSGPSPRARRPP